MNKKQKGEDEYKENQLQVLLFLTNGQVGTLEISSSLSCWYTNV